MAHALSRYIIDFDLGAPPGNVAEPEVKQVYLPREDPVDNTADLILAAEEQARREGMASARREFEAALAAERVQADERLAAERERWAQEQADRIAERFTEALQDLETRLNDGLARVVTPFLTNALRQRMLDELAATLSILLADKGHPVMRVSGPDDMLCALSAKLGACGCSIEFATADTPDVCVLAGDTVIETQMNMWAGRLAEAVQAS